MTSQIIFDCENLGSREALLSKKYNLVMTIPLTVFY